MKNYKFIAETPSHFVLHNSKAHFHVAKNGIDTATADKIRALAKGGQIQAQEEKDIEAQAQGKQTSQEKQIESSATPSPTPDPTDYVKYNNPDKFAEGGKLSTSDRAHIAPKNFAGPDRSYPIEDASHARNALARVSQHGSPELQAQVRAKVHSKYPGIEQSKFSGGAVQHFEEGTPDQPVTNIDPDKAKEISDSFKGALGFDEGGKVQNYYDKGNVEQADPAPQRRSDPEPSPAPTSDPYQAFANSHITPQDISEGTRNANRNPASIHRAGGGPVASNAVKDISHETQSQAIGRYAAGNPANLAQGGSTHHTQGKYHFHFYDGGPVTHSDKYPDAPPTPLDNYAHFDQGTTSGDATSTAADQMSDSDKLAAATQEIESGLNSQETTASQPDEAPANSATPATSSEGTYEPAPTVPKSQQIPGTPPPNTAAAVPDKSDMLTQLNADIKGEQDAILGGKTEEAKGFTEQAKAIQANLKQQQDANDTYKQEADLLTMQNETLFRNVRDDKIQPKTFWDIPTTGGKIAAGIALMLGGISSGYTGKSNPALDVLQKTIQNDIEAQKANQAQGVNLYRLGLEKYRDQQSAHQYATMQANAILQGQLSKIASQTGSQTAQFQAQQAIHQIGLQNAELRSSLSLRQAAIQSMNSQPTMQGGLNLDKSRLLTMAGVIPKEEQSNIDKESENYQKLSNYLDEVDDLAKSTSQNATYSERIAEGIPGGSLIPTMRDKTKAYLAQTNAFLDKATKDLTGRVTPQSMENLSHSMFRAGDTPDVIAAKVKTLKDIGRSGYQTPTLLKYGIIRPNDPVITSDATRNKRFTEGPAK